MTKPKITAVKSGESGNIFGIIGNALAALRKSGKDVEVGTDMMLRAHTAKNFKEATDIVSEYVDIEWKD